MACTIRDFDGKTPEQLSSWLVSGGDMRPEKPTGIFWNKKCDAHDMKVANFAVENVFRSQVRRIPTKIILLS